MAKFECYKVNNCVVLQEDVSEPYLQLVSYSYEALCVSCML